MGKFISETGNIYGRLTVLDRAPNIGRWVAWNVRCECGNEKVVIARSLVSGNTRSCGCLNREICSEMFTKSIPFGTRFGYLVVIGKAESSPVCAMWLTRCDCGKERIVPGAQLRIGKANSCSINCPFVVAEATSTQRQIMIQYTKNAKSRGLSFTLNDEQFEKLLQGECHYCGVPPSNVRKRRSTTVYRYNGIDRVDNSIGYDYGNCVTCCRNCNVAKMDRSYEDFVAWIHQASSYLLKSENKRVA